jgi:hypothetical protein
VQLLPFAVLIFPYPPIKETAIVVMDGVSKDTMELLICSREDLQERVIGSKPILHPRHVRSVGVWTNGGGVVTLTIDSVPGGYITRTSALPMGVGIVYCAGAFGAASRLPEPSDLLAGRPTDHPTNRPTDRLTHHQ